MLDGKQKRYVSPIVAMSTFECADVVTASNEDNLGGMPNSWMGAFSQGGNIE